MFSLAENRTHDLLGLSNAVQYHALNKSATAPPKLLFSLHLTCHLPTYNLKIGSNCLSFPPSSLSLFLSFQTVILFFCLFVYGHHFYAIDYCLLNLFLSFGSFLVFCLSLFLTLYQCLFLIHILSLSFSLCPCFPCKFIFSLSFKLALLSTFSLRQ